MKLSELFKRLSYGELSNLAVGQEGSGVITPSQIPKLVRYTNEALLRLYSRFLLLEKVVIIEQVAHLTSYELRAKNAESAQKPGTTVLYPFIKDQLGEPFTGDVIKILEVYDSLNRLMPLNDASQHHSVFTPYPDVIQVPRPLDGAAMSILYQARHPVVVDEAAKLPAGMSDILAQEIEIPFALESALQSMIAAAVYSHMNGQENIAKSQEYLSWAETVCLEVEQKDLVSQSHTTRSSKFEQRGFV